MRTRLTSMDAEPAHNARTKTPAPPVLRNVTSTHTGSTIRLFEAGATMWVFSSSTAVASEVLVVCNLLSLMDSAGGVSTGVVAGGFTGCTAE